jgi:hypothetical protein
MNLTDVYLNNKYKVNAPWVIILVNSDIPDDHYATSFRGKYIVAIASHPGFYKFPWKKHLGSTPMISMESRNSFIKNQGIIIGNKCNEKPGNWDDYNAFINGEFKHDSWDIIR